MLIEIQVSTSWEIWTNLSSLMWTTIIIVTGNALKRTLARWLFSRWVSPVVTFAMEQRLGVAIQISCRVVSLHALLFIVQRDEECRLLDGVQRLLIEARSEELLPYLSPGDPWSGDTHLIITEMLFKFPFHMHYTHKYKGYK